jgi:hypothetical protein
MRDHIADIYRNFPGVELGPGHIILSVLMVFQILSRQISRQLFKLHHTQLLTYLGTALAQWLRYCATNRKVAGSIPDGVIGIFHLHIPSDRTMALESTQLLTEMSTRSISWGVKAAAA